MTIRKTRLLRWAEEADARKAREFALVEDTSGEQGEAVPAGWLLGLPLRAISALLGTVKSTCPGPADRRDRDGTI